MVGRVLYSQRLRRGERHLNSSILYVSQIGRTVPLIGLHRFGTDAIVKQPFPGDGGLVVQAYRDGYRLKNNLYIFHLDAPFLKYSIQQGLHLIDREVLVVWNSRVRFQPCRRWLLR